MNRPLRFLNCSANIRIIFEICKFFVLMNATKSVEKSELRRFSQTQVSSSAQKETPLRRGNIIYRVSYLKIPTSIIMCQLCPLISIYISLRGNLSDPLLSRISTWGISNLHVEVFYSPRRREIKLRRNQMKLRRKRMKLRRNFFFLTWEFRNIHVEITFPRHDDVLICSRL